VAGNELVGVGRKTLLQRIWRVHCLIWRGICWLWFFVCRNWRHVSSLLGTFAVIIGSGLVSIPPVFLDLDDDQKNWTEIRWTAALVLFGVILAAVGSVSQSAALIRLRKKYDGARAAATVAETVAMREMVHRSLELLETLRQVSASSQSMPRRLAEYRPLVSGMIGTLREYFSRDGVSIKANYYRLEKEDGRYVLRVIDRTFEARREVIRGDDEEGRDILRRTLRGDWEYCEDIQADHRHHRQGENRDYRCFASVAAEVNGQIHGMVSLNTPIPGGISEDLAREYLKFAGLIFASAESSLGLSVPHKKGQPTGMSEAAATVSTQ
jgi:hypothetical protein